MDNCADRRTREHDAWEVARYHTLRTLREYPELPKWYAEHGVNDEDRAHRKIVAKWLRQVLRHTSDRPNRIERLLDWAQDFLLFEQSEQLANTWHSVVEGPKWSRLSPAAKWLYRLVHAMAQELDDLGGQSVLLSNRAGVRGIEILGGPRYRSIGTITNARTELLAADLVTVKPGQPWEKDKYSRATRYTLPLTTGSELSPYAEARDSSIGSCEPVPRLSEQQRDALDDVFEQSRTVRRRAAMVYHFGTDVLPDEYERAPLPEPMVSTEDFARLLTEI